MTMCTLLASTTNNTHTHTLTHSCFHIYSLASLDDFLKVYLYLIPTKAPNPASTKPSAPTSQHHHMHLCGALYARQPTTRWPYKPNTKLKKNRRRSSSSSMADAPSGSAPSGMSSPITKASDDIAESLTTCTTTSSIYYQDSSYDSCPVPTNTPASKGSMTPHTPVSKSRRNSGNETAQGNTRPILVSLPRRALDD